jgi:hypothetical protein
MAQKFEDEHWRPIAKQITKEMDRKKLALLIAQLCRALDEREKLQQPQTGSDYGFRRDSPLMFLN